MTESQAKQILKTWTNDINAFVEDCFPHYLTHKVPDFHLEIYKILNSSQRIAIAAPRGFAKSHLVSVFYVLHQAIFGFKKDICIISASENLAIEWLRKVKREIETNPVLNRFFGDLRSDKWSESHIILKNGVNIRAKGAEGQIRGFRPDLVILDDIETDDSVASEEQRNKLRDWVYKACLNTLMPNGQFIIIGTLLTNLSLLQEILDGQKEWVRKKYQAYHEGVQEEKRELWPELWSHQRLQQRKAEIGTFRFACEYMNDPVSNETAPIKEHQIRYWDKLPNQYSCVIAVDPAYSEDTKSDYKVAVVVAMDSNANRYLLTYLRTHKPMGEFIDGVLNLFMQYKGFVTKVGLPNSGTEKEFYRSVTNRATERKIFPPFVELKHTFVTATGESKRNKKERTIAALQPLFESGKYYIAPNHHEAREEILTIGASRWDDLTDAMSYAESILTPVFYDASRPEWFEEEAVIIRGDTGYGM